MNKIMTLTSFSIQKQLEFDPFFKDLKGTVYVTAVDKIVEPQIPCLLPKEIKTIKLQANNYVSNYLTTALTSIASHEEMVYTVLGSDALSEDGKYLININEMGETLPVTINDEILSMKERSKYVPFFCSSAGNDIWAHILEKAYAVKYGLYSLIADGEPHEVIHSFLDGDYKIYDLKKDKSEPVWSFLKSHFRADEAKNAENQPVNEYMDFNLNESHKIIIASRNSAKRGPFSRVFFKIVDFRSVKPKEKADKLKYIKLQVIDKSLSELKGLSMPWSEEETQLISTTQYGEGFFWISFADLIKHFDSLSINYYKMLNLKPEYNKAVLKMGLEGNHSCALIHFDAPEEDDKFVIGVHQKHKNYFKNIKDNYKYANLRVILIKLEEVNKQNLAKNLHDQEGKGVLDRFEGKKVYTGRFESSTLSKGNSLADVFLKARLKKGRYLLAIEVFWKVDYFMNLNISICTTMNAKIEPKLISSGSNFDVVLYKTFVSYYLEIHEKSQKGEENKETGPGKSKSLKNKVLNIVEPASEQLLRASQDQKGSLKPDTNGPSIPANLKINYMELMEGFYIVYCSYMAGDNNLRLHLEINKDLLKDSFIISPELMRLLQGEVLSLDNIFMDVHNPFMFFLIRRNLDGLSSSEAPLKIEKFFTGSFVSVISPEAETPPARGVTSLTAIPNDSEKKKLYAERISNLYFEHLYLESTLEASIPFLRRPDREILQSLAKATVREDDFQQKNLLTYLYRLDQPDSDLINDTYESESLVEINQEAMLNILKKYGRVTHRVWEGIQTKITEYLLASDNFLAILLENNENELTYVENRHFSLTNLQYEGYENPEEPLKPTPFDTPTVLDLTFTLKPRDNKLLVFNVRDGNEGYTYDYSTSYKLT